jgi:hypothetical protein
MSSTAHASPTSNEIVLCACEGVRVHACVHDGYTETSLQKAKTKTICTIGTEGTTHTDGGRVQSLERLEVETSLGVTCSWAPWGTQRRLLVIASGHAHAVALLEACYASA